MPARTGLSSMSRMHVMRVAFALHQGRFEQGSRAPICDIGIPPVAATDRLHQAGTATRSLAHRPQVGVVRHQHERVKLAAVHHQGFAQVFAIVAVIVVVEK